MSAVVAEPLFEAPAARTLAELHDELAALVLARVDRGECGCGCGEPLPASRGGNGRLCYVRGHRQRAHRKRLELEAKALGVAPRLSLRALNEASTTGQRHGDAQPRRKARQRRPRPGVTIYLATPGLARRLLEQMRWAPDLGDHLDADDHAAIVKLLEQALERAAARERSRL